jgi:hypothetical protein
MTIEYLMEHKDGLEELAGQLSAEDIEFLANLLSEKNNDIRYAAFQTLLKRSEISSDLYSYWDSFAARLSNENSYQRSIGIMMLAENVRWDKEGRFNGIFKEYMAHCQDEKFITSRQTIQSIRKWLPYKPELLPQIIQKLSAISIEELAPTQKKLILVDIINVFLDIQKAEPHDEITDYILKALSGGLLDKKASKSIQQALNL